MADLPDDFPKRRLKIDMGELAAAFNQWGMELSRFLDLETGEILLIQGEEMRFLEGLYEEYDEALQAGQDMSEMIEALEGVPDWQKEVLRDADRVEAGFGKRYICVPEADSSEGYGDMQAFIWTVQNPRLQNQLERAISGRGAFRRFKDVLLDYPAERERWFAFQEARLRERVLDWLDAEGIELVE